MYNLAGQLQGTGASMQVTITFFSGLGAVSSSAINTLANACADINNNYGVPIYLRIGNEMNGNWYPWVFIVAFYNEILRMM